MAAVTGLQIYNGKIRAEDSEKAYTEKIDLFNP